MWDMDRYGTYIARTRQSDIARVEAGALKQTSSAAEAAAISEVDVQALCLVGSGDLGVWMVWWVSEDGMPFKMRLS